ncbi:unnamed protein product (macronuclear) [Paramecium tetraurelia]|uniref:Uncharacterized protein n=1 Tax=Paramecium tetraurelia TaxID=5888 RepID=A0BCV4_PARTE|nr:uncharacterized protein GSPATT00004465001 [Paramecium tetraurelia]CAK56371.1 unnamed protein product [Paramecium tetraurelia]|eukprot:XP_001423769.1 hypothetical protein (macronuclear) [Paramecium tetraurelia strain d4-2]
MFSARDQLSFSRKTIQHFSIASQKPIRYATQYCGDAEYSSSIFNSDYELLRTKEKYKQKCEEIDMKKNQLNSDHLDLEFRAEKLRQGENEVKYMAELLKKKLKQIKQQEQQIKENQSSFADKFRDKEQSLIEQQKLIKEKQDQLILKEEQLKVREQSLKEKESLLQEQTTYYTQFNERLKINIEETNKKECIQFNYNLEFYIQQISKMNQTVETLLYHENHIRDLEFRLTQQIQGLKDFDNQIRQQQTAIEELIDQKEQGILKSQELINRKLLWDQKNITRQHLQQISNYMTDQKYY